jgi:hypothetical protein
MPLALPEAFDLVITDRRMLGMTGEGHAAVAKEQASVRKIRVFVQCRYMCKNPETGGETVDGMKNPHPGTGKTNVMARFRVLKIREGLRPRRSMAAATFSLSLKGTL